MRLLVGNDFSEDVREDRGWTGWWVQRLVWFAEDGDVLVLPTEPDEAFFRYATGLLGVRRSSLQVVVPPRAEGEGAMLNARRLADPSFRAALGEALRGERPTKILSLWPDAAVAQLAGALDAERALDGAGFMEQDGGRLVNSKTVFRAIARGVGVPVPRGAVCATKEAALSAICALLAEGRVAMVKQDYLSGGHGNEILSRSGSFRPFGARRVVPVPDDAAVARYLDEMFDAISGGGRNRFVVEEYYRDSRPYFAEFLVADEGVELAGTGVMLCAPFAAGQIMPVVDLDATALECMVREGRRLCEALHAMGYRGMCSADAIVTPHGEVLFTEYNGRITGSTHIYGVIGRKIIGEGFGRDRFILEKVWSAGWSVASFEAAVERATAAGLAYDPARRAGVVFSNAFDEVYKGVMYCIVAENLDAAWRVDRELGALFGGSS